MRELDSSAKIPKNDAKAEAVRSQIDTSQLSESEALAVDKLTHFGKYDLKDPQLAYYLKENGINGLRIFSLAAEHPAVAPDALRLARTLNGPHIRDLFAACAGLMDAAKDTSAYASETFGRKLSDEQEVKSQRLLRDKAADLITRAAKQMPNESVEQLMHWPERIQKVMSDVTAVAKSESAKARLFTTIFRLLRREGEVPLEEIREASFEELAGGSITPTDGEAILRIQMEQYGGKYPESMLKELRGNLGDALKRPFTKFYLFRKSGEIVTYVRFDQLSTSNDLDKKHMASFMINPKFEGSALGQAMLELALEKELEKGAVYAECDPSLVPFYEKFGFVKLRQYKDDHGVDTCDIVLEPQAEALREAA